MPRWITGLVTLWIALALAQAPAVAQDVSGGVIVGGAVGTIVGGAQIGPGVVAIPGAPARDAQIATGRSTLRGRLTDAATGAPLRRASVRITAPELRGMRQATSDNDGRYEVSELPAGHYMLTATKTGYVDMSFGQRAPNEQSPPVTLADRQMMDKVDIALPRGGVITGRVVDEFGEPLIDAQVVPVQLRSMQGGRRPISTGRSAAANDIGEFRIFGLAPGRYYLSVSVSSRNFVMNGVPVAQTDRAGYAVTFYPAAARLEDAQPINIGLGETISDLVVTALPTTIARVSGSVLDAQGQVVAQGFVNAMPANTMGFGASTSGGQILNGRFTLSGLPPGEYVLRATIGMPTPGQPPQFAVATVSINGSDLDGVTLAPVVPVTLRGRLVLGPGASSTLRPQSVRLAASPLNPFAQMMAPTPMMPAVVRDDLTFELSAAPGDITIRAMGLPPGWLTREVRLDGKDVTAGFTLRPDNNGVVEFEITDRIPTVTGTVSNRRGETVTSYSVVAFPQDSREWANPQPAHYTMTRPNNDGLFTIRTLLPGDFFIVAVDRLQNGEWMDPEFMERVRPMATAVRLGEGDAQTLSLRLVEQPR